MSNYDNVAGFTWKDVQHIYPEWSQEQCEKAFNDVYNNLHERLVEEGWEILKVLLQTREWEKE